jgi:hypothetical protein
MKNTHLLCSVATLALTINMFTPSQSVAMNDEKNLSKTTRVSSSSEAKQSDDVSTSLVSQMNQQQKMTPTVDLQESSVELHITRHSPLLVFSLPDKTEVHVNNGNQVWVKTATQGYPATPWENYASANKFNFRVNVRQGDADSLELRIPRGSKAFSFFAESEVAVDHTSTWVKEKNGPGYYATSFDDFAKKIGLPNAKAILADVRPVSMQVKTSSTSGTTSFVSSTLSSDASAANVSTSTASSSSSEASSSSASASTKSSSLPSRNKKPPLVYSLSDIEAHIENLGGTTQKVYRKHKKKMKLSHIKVSVKGHTQDFYFPKNNAQSRDLKRQFLSFWKEIGE